MSRTRRDLPEHRLVVGMEVHLQLRTRTKAFCGCDVEFGAPPNTHVCPTCLGLPGALPALNRAAVEQAIRGGLGLGCTIAPLTKWDRKNYFYPDLAKGYQITQFDLPLCENGVLEIEGKGGPVRVGIVRAHLEEDTGKSVHAGDGTARVRIDYNRCGTPLLEIVSRPDLHSADDASRYLEELRRIMRTLDVSDCEMEKAQLRCEPNVNVHVRVDDEWVPTRIVELKNLNSFAAVRNAIEFERVRQIEELLAGAPAGPLPKSTRGWDDGRRETFLQRAKEDAADYRYFPEPDLPPLEGADRWADELRATLPELPRARRERFATELGVAAEHAAVLTETRELADWFERAAAASGDAAATAKWTVSDVLRELNARDLAPDEFPAPAEAFGEFVAAVGRGDIPREAAKSSVFPALAETGRPWREIVKELGLEATGGDALAGHVAAVIEANPDIVAKARGGKPQVLAVLLGQVMKRTRGTAKPNEVRAALEKAVLGSGGLPPA